MSKKDGGQAFPTPETECHENYEGMTLRDYFAAKAVQSLVSTWGPTTATAEYAYKFADAMLKAREDKS